MTGFGLVNELKRYNPKLSVTVAPAFRFDSIHSFDLHQQNSHIGLLTILAMLPISLNESLNILSLLTEYVKHKEEQSVRILIKPHPVLNMHKLRSVFSPWPLAFEEVKWSFPELVIQADIMISNTSSTCMEALAYGVPVIIAGSRSGITQNPIPHSVPKTIWDLCYTVDELNKAVKKLCAGADKQKREEQLRIAKEIQMYYFEPATEDGIRELLMLTKDVI